MGGQADLGPCLSGVGTLCSSHLEVGGARMNQAVCRLEGEAWDGGSFPVKGYLRGEETD